MLDVSPLCLFSGNLDLHSENVCGVRERVGERRLLRSPRLVISQLKLSIQHSIRYKFSNLAGNNCIQITAGGWY